MASYTDNRNALFASKSDGTAPPSLKTKATPKAPLSLGGPSAAAVAKKKEQEAALRSKGDALFAEAEAPDHALPVQQAALQALPKLEEPKVPRAAEAGTGFLLGRLCSHSE